MRVMIRQSESESLVPDADLFHAYLNGDAKAFEQLLRRYEKTLFTFIVRMVCDQDEAKDIFQDTLIRVIQRIRSYTEQGKFSQWLFGIAHHLCVDRLRKQKRWKIHIIADVSDDGMDPPNELVDHEPLADALLEQNELINMIEHALAHLSPEQREVFLLRQHSDLTFREIAEMLNRPLNTVLSQMRNAVLSIKKILREKIK